MYHGSFIQSSIVGHLEEDHLKVTFNLDAQDKQPWVMRRFLVAAV